MTAVGYNERTLQERIKLPPVKKKSSRNLDTRRQIHFTMMRKFFSRNENAFNTMFDIVNQNSPISLRLLEFICTVMAKDGLTLTTPMSGFRSLSMLYQSHIESQGKGFFDPFRRNPKSKFTIKCFGKTIETNIAQLRFFRFAILNGVIQYAKDNFRDVETAMSEYTATRRHNNTPIPLLTTQTPTSPTTPHIPPLSRRIPIKRKKQRKRKSNMGAFPIPKRDKQADDDGTRTPSHITSVSLSFPDATGLPM